MRKSNNLLKVLGGSVIFLGTILMFILIYSVIYGVKQQNELEDLSDIESRYISTENTDQKNLPEENSKVEIKDESIPEKQGKLELKESRQVLKVERALSEKEILLLEQKYEVEFTKDTTNKGIYVLDVKEDSNVSGLSDELSAQVEVDIPVRISADLVDWGITRIGADKIWTSSTGSAIKVAVIDTGVQTDHSDLQANILSGYDFVNNDNNPYDDNGHGTHVAGIVSAVQNQTGIIGASYNSKILPVKVLNAQGYGYMSDIAKGIYFATDNGARVINMSFGSTSDSSILKDAITYAANKGVLLVGAAGNDSGAPCNYPAAYSSVICVVATDNSNRLASFSNLGGELAAPGVSNYSTYTGGGYKYLSGTSMAAPHVAGASALLMSACPNCTTLQIRNTLKDTAIDLGNQGVDIIFGYGLVDLVSAMNKIQPLSPIEEPNQEEPTNQEPTPSKPIPSKPDNKQNETLQIIKIVEPETTSNNRYTPQAFGNINIKFGLEPLISDSKLSQIVLLLDNEPIFSTTKQEDEYTIPTELLSPSQHWLMAKATFSDGRESQTRMIIDLTKFKTVKGRSSSNKVLGISSYFNFGWIFER